MNVGSGRGTVDKIVADSFFAVGEPGVTPTLAFDLDPNVYLTGPAMGYTRHWR